MKILSLSAANIKRISVVEIKPSGSMVEISGANGQGKTSVLDSIFWALAGTKNIQDQPIRKGEEKAVVKLDLGELKVTRRFTKSGSTITVENADGAKYPSPQAMLDALTGNLTFDPLEFMRMDRDKQFKTLRGMVKLDVDPEALDRQNKTDFDARTDLNREIKRIEGQLTGFNLPQDLPAVAIDTGAMVDKIASAGKVNGEIVLSREAFKRNKQQFTDGIAAAKDIALNYRARAEELRKEAMHLDSLAGSRELEAQELSVALANLKEPTDQEIDTAVLQVELQQAQKTNDSIRRRTERDALAAQVKAKQQESEVITGRMYLRDKQKMDAISRAQMPVPGLGFGQQAVTYNGLPLDQASDAEQLRVSCAIAMAANPKLRVLRVRDGSLLDDKSMALLAEMAETHDYQVWCEMLKGGPAAIVMEDGHVKGESA
jgi:hypothetical protein